MALIDTSALLLDPDFSDCTLIQRAVAVNDYGENVITETTTAIKACVENSLGEVLDRMPDGARLTDLITVYYRGLLTAEQPGGYADVIVWQGRRYQVKEVAENYLNFGQGHTMAHCLLEPVSA